MLNGSQLYALTSNTTISFTGISPVTASDFSAYSNALIIDNASYEQSSYAFNISTSINESTLNYDLDSSAFPAIFYNDLSMIRIYSNATNTLNLSISNITIQSCNLIDTINYYSAKGDYTENIPLSSFNCSINTLSISLRNIENTQAGNPNYFAIKYSTQNLGGGSGASSGAGNPGGLPNVTDLYLCGQTYDYIANHGQGDYSYINDLQASMQSQNHTYDSTMIENYIVSWQYFCSDAMNRTLDEDFVCKKIYYYMVGINGSVDYVQLQDQINPTIRLSYPLLQHYVNDFNSACSQTGLSSPNFRQPSNFSNLNIFRNFHVPFPDIIANLSGVMQGQLLDCVPQLNLSIVGYNMDYSMPFFRIGLGNIGCRELNTLRWFFSIEQDSSGYSLKGIKMPSIFLILFIAALIVMLMLRHPSGASHSDIMSRHQRAREHLESIS